MKKNLKKKIENFSLKFLFFWIFFYFKSPASGKENVRFPDSPDFENLPEFRTGRDVRLSPSSQIASSNTHCSCAHTYLIRPGGTYGDSWNSSQPNFAENWLLLMLYFGEKVCIL